MAVEFITKRVTIEQDTGSRQIDDHVPFQKKVRVANVALGGFLLTFARSDHHITVVEVATTFAGAEGEIVRFRVNVQYADRNADDEYSGHVDVLVIADLQDA